MTAARPGDIVTQGGTRYRLMTRLERGKAAGRWHAVEVDENDEQVGTAMVEVEV